MRVVISDKLLRGNVTLTGLTNHVPDVAGEDKEGDIEIIEGSSRFPPLHLMIEETERNSFEQTCTYKNPMG